MPAFLRLAACAALLFPLSALAAGASIPDIGARELGEGNAAVARPADGSACYYNPAGFADLEGLQLYADLRVADQRVQYQRLEANGTNPSHFSPVENQGGVTLAPMVTASWLVKRPDWPAVAIALGGFPSTGGSGYIYPDPAVLRAAGTQETLIARQAPQRYLSIESHSKIFVPFVAAAVQLNSWASVGAELQLPVASFVVRQAIYAGPVQGELTDFDAIINVNATERVAQSGLFGVTLRPLPWLDVGAALQLPTRYNARGTVTATLPPSAGALGLSVSGNQVGAALTFPWVARAGARATKGALSVELAGTYEGWSMLKEIRLTPQDVVVHLSGNDLPLGALVIQKQMNDAGSLRLGGEWRADALQLPWLTLRAGVLAESSAIPEERQSLDWVHWQRLSLNAGAGFRYGRSEVSVAVARFLQPERQVRDSLVSQTAALAGVPPSVVGNGNYDTQITLVALSVTTQL